MSESIVSDVFNEAAIQDAISYLSEKNNSCGIDGIRLSELASYWKINGSSILSQLENGCYEPGMVRITEILGQQGKRRRISVFCSIDRLLMRCLSQFTQRIADSVLHDCCFAFRSSLGVPAAVHKMIEYIQSGYLWEVRVDIRNYFDSIPLSALDTILGEIIEHTELLCLIRKFLHLRAVNPDGTVDTVRQGLLQGSSLAPVLSNLYLTPLDGWLSGLNMPFCRYCDDIVVCFKSKHEAECFYPQLCQTLKENYALDINQKKSGILETTRQQFLGYSFHVNPVDGTVTAFRAKQSTPEIRRDWQKIHIEQQNQDYRIINDGILTQKDFSLLFEGADGKHHIPIETMGALNIYSDVVFGSGFFRFAAQKHLCISIFDRHGNLCGTYTPAESGSRTKNMLKQAAIYMSHDSRLKVAREIELGAFFNLRANLRYYAKTRHSEKLADGIEILTGIMQTMKECVSIDQLMLLEARGRQIYYTMFNEILQNPSFVFVNRSRRPPRDPLNAMISFGNTYLYQRIASEIEKTSLDIRIGFLHSTNKRSQSLNLDVAELFKPLIVDRAIFTLINKRSIDVSCHFQKMENGGIYLTSDGLRLYLSELNRKVEQYQIVNGRPLSYGERIRIEVRKLSQYVKSGIPYKAYRYY